MKKFTAAETRDLFGQVVMGEISLSRMVEILNEMVSEAEDQPSPKIKRLEWTEYENFRGRKSYFAKTPFSPYEVADGGNHYTMFSANKRLRFASANEAKAAAQADFERRVKECLDV